MAGVIAARAARVHRRRQRVGEHAHDGRRRVHPAPEARMPVAEGVRLDGLFERAEDVVGRHRRHGCGCGEELPGELGRHGVKRRLAREGREVVGDQIDDAVPDALNFFTRQLAHSENR
jgi:hypothetical protein